jgi:hypothetical protein
VHASPVLVPGGRRFDWKAGDMFAAPSWVPVEHHAGVTVAAELGFAGLALLLWLIAAALVAAFRRAGAGFEGRAALAAIREIGPGGHYLGTQHTLEHFETAFFMPKIMDFNSFEQWSAEGALDHDARGREKAKTMLAAYEEPRLDEAVEEKDDGEKVRLGMVVRVLIHLLSALVCIGSSANRAASRSSEATRSSCSRP